jgi:hypothetical protein
MPLGTRQVASARPSAIQLNHIGIAEDANKWTGRHVLVDLSATEFSDGRTGAFCSFPS